MVEVLAVEEERGPDPLRGEGVQHDAGAVVGAVVEGQVEGGVAVASAVVGHGGSVVAAVHRLRPVALIGHCMEGVGGRVMGK